jgi:glucan phosphorylase
MPDPLVNLQAVCRALRLTSRRVQQLISDGIIPRPEGATKGAKYDLLKTLWAYQDWREEQLKKQFSKGKVVDEIQQVELQTKQFKLEREKGLWIERHLVADELVKRIYAIKRDQLAIERRLTKWPEAKEAVKKAHRAMWRAYSRKTGVFKDASK